MSGPFRRPQVSCEHQGDKATFVICAASCAASYHPLCWHAQKSLFLATVTSNASLCCLAKFLNLANAKMTPTAKTSKLHLHRAMWWKEVAAFTRSPTVTRSLKQAMMSSRGSCDLTTATYTNYGSKRISAIKKQMFIFSWINLRLWHTAWHIKAILAIVSQHEQLPLTATCCHQLKFTQILQPRATKQELNMHSRR